MPHRPLHHRDRKPTIPINTNQIDSERAGSMSLELLLAKQRIGEPNAERGDLPIRTHSQDQYHKRYVSNPDGMIGDISAKKQWHEHFSRSALSALLKKSGFAVVRFGGTGLFSRPIGQ